MDEHSTRRTDLERRKRRPSPPYRSVDDDRPRDPERSRDPDRYPPRQGRRKPRRRFRWLPPAAAFLLVVWFSPMLVSKTPLGAWAIHNAVRDLRGDVQYHSLSLGWLSPITIEGLEVDDADHQTVIKVARASTGKRLFGWLLNRHDLGTIRVEDPQVNLVFGRQDTNLEQVFAHWLKEDPRQKDQHRPKSPIALLREAGITSFELDIAGGAVAMIDQPASRRTNLDNLQASIRMTATDDGLRARVQGNAEQEQHIAPFEATLQIAPETRGMLAAQNQLSLKSDGLPMWVVAALGRRMAPGLELEGELTSNIDCTWQQTESGLSQATVKADVLTKNLFCTAAALKGDQIRLGQAHLPVELKWQNNQLAIQQAGLECELGKLSFVGTIDTAAGWIKSLHARPYQVTGHLDLAKLATMLPNTIRVRSDTRVTAGVVDLVINADEKPTGLVWQGRLDASDLVATTGSQTLSWQKPVHMEFTAHETPQGLAVDRVYGEADFLELQGEGTPTDGHLSASFDFNKLADQLARIIDMSSLRLAGSGDAHISWQLEGEHQFQSSANMNVKNFELTRPGNRPWREAQLELSGDLAGMMTGAKLTSINSAEMRLVAGPDILTARLHQPVLNLSDGGLWSIAIKLQGELARWLPRAEPWLGSYAEYELAGDCDVTADVVCSTTSLEVEPLAARIHNLRLAGPSANVQEPMIDLTATGIWNRENRQVSMSDARLSSSALTAEAREVVLVFDAKNASQLNGKLTYSGDLGRLWQWHANAQFPSPWQVGGRFSGSATIERKGEVVQANFENRVDSFFANNPSQLSWQEPELIINAKVEHDGHQKLVKLSQFTLSAQALACSAVGQITDLDSSRNLRLDGRVRYDLARLAPLWQEFTGPGVRIEGLDERSFSIQGPLAVPHSRQPAAHDGLVVVHHVRGGAPAGSPKPDPGSQQFQASAELHWAGADVYGFAVGPGDLRARLAGGLVNFDPIRMMASQGQLNLTPTIRLNPGPAMLTVAPGHVADNIQITPEMCERALKFIAPPLANVTDASGVVSVELEGCQVPLATPKQGDVSGKMTVHTVTISTSPLIRELSVLMNHGAGAEFAHDSTVEFRMVDGRIYHRGLELRFPEFAVRTYGSVGLDESLAIVAELPVPPKWLANEVMVQSLKGQTIQLPINGTLRNPKLDEKVLAQTSAKFLGRAATGAIKSGLMNGLDHIFGPRP